MLSPSPTYLFSRRHRLQTPSLLTSTFSKGSGVVVLDEASPVAVLVDVVKASEAEVVTTALPGLQTVSIAMFRPRCTAEMLISDTMSVLAQYSNICSSRPL